MKSKDPIILRNRKRCLMAMISATVVSLCVFSGGIMNLVSVYDENFSHVGKGTFSLFYGQLQYPRSDLHAALYALHH